MEWFIPCLKGNGCSSLSKGKSCHTERKFEAFTSWISYDRYCLTSLDVIFATESYFTSVNNEILAIDDARIPTSNTNIRFLESIFTFHIESPRSSRKESRYIAKDWNYQVSQSCREFEEFSASNKYRNNSKPWSDRIVWIFVGGESIEWSSLRCNTGSLTEYPVHPIS